MEWLGVGRFKRRDRYGPLDSQGLTKHLDAFDLMHGFRGEVRLAACWTGPQRHTFDNQKAGASTEAARHMLELN